RARQIREGEIDARQIGAGQHRAGQRRAPEIAAALDLVAAGQTFQRFEPGLTVARGRQHRLKARGAVRRPPSLHELLDRVPHTVITLLPVRAASLTATSASSHARTSSGSFDDSDTGAPTW